MIPLVFFQKYIKLKTEKQIMNRDSLEKSTNAVAEQIVNCINGNGEEIKKLYDCLNHLNDKTKIRFKELEERVDLIEKNIKNKETIEESLRNMITKMENYLYISSLLDDIHEGEYTLKHCLETTVENHMEIIKQELKNISSK